MIGSTGASVPNVSVDLGVADIHIKDNARTIQYTGKGEQTNVGELVDSPTKGMTIGGAGTKGHAYARKVYPKHSVSRTDMDTEEPVRGETAVGGINRPKITDDTKAMVEGIYEEPAPKTEQIKEENKDKLPDLLATGYGKERYFDEDEEWLESLEPSILNTRKKSVNRVKASRPKLGRGSSSATTLGSVRL
jgi:hypothetical protein